MDREGKPSSQALHPEPDSDTEEGAQGPGLNAGLLQTVGRTGLPLRRSHQALSDTVAATAEQLEREEQALETLRFELLNQAVDAPDGVKQLVANKRMMDALDRVREDIIEESESHALQSSVSVSIVEGAALATSIGWLGLLSRAPSLAAAALSSLPMWSRVDPLAVLTISEEERKRREKDLHDAEAEEDRTERAVGNLLDDEEVE